MDFTKTGLPPAVQQAFDYAYETTMPRLLPEELEKYNKRRLRVYEARVEALEEMKAEGKVPDAKYPKLQKMIQKMYEAELKEGPAQVGDMLDKKFMDRRVGAAKEILASEDPSPDLMSAALLLDSVRSPVDYEGVLQSFGPHVATVVAQVKDVDAWPAQREETLRQTSPEAKRVYVAAAVAEMNRAAAEIEAAAAASPARQVTVPEGHEAWHFATARAAWGNDKKLDRRFEESFNRELEALNSEYRIASGAKGPELVKGLAVKKERPLLPPAPSRKDAGPSGGLPGNVF